MLSAAIKSTAAKDAATGQDIQDGYGSAIADVTFDVLLNCI